ncbi:MAG: leucine-rich repeat domain-containing protein [Acholeplasmatales bacterium]|nr:leucine-rich repeat domain-containing protein [Acholeplasmatales bacterium]
MKKNYKFILMMFLVLSVLVSCTSQKGTSTTDVTSLPPTTTQTTTTQSTVPVTSTTSTPTVTTTTTLAPKEVRIDQESGLIPEDAFEIQLTENTNDDSYYVSRVFFDETKEGLFIPSKYENKDIRNINLISGENSQIKWMYFTNNIETISFLSIEPDANVYYEGTIEDWCKIRFSNRIGMNLKLYLLDENGTEQFNEKKFSLLTNLTIPGNILSIGNSQFEGFICLENVTIQSGVETIGYNSFAFCYNIKSIILADTITKIDTAAFRDCRRLTAITIPSSVTRINSPFSGCYMLTEVYNLSNINLMNRLEDLKVLKIHTVADEPSILTTDENGYVFAYVNNKGYLVGYIGTDKELSLPSSFVFDNNVINAYEIKNNIFNGDNDIISVTIPNSVSAIGMGVFNDARNLENISYSGTVEEWNEISKIYQWYCNIPANKVVCSNGEVELPNK